jgi:hypothetical protein
MARKPNYRYERAERERRKAERRAVRDQRKAESRGDATNTEQEPAQDGGDGVAGTAETLSWRRDG